MGSGMLVGGEEEIGREDSSAIGDMGFEELRGRARCEMACWCRAVWWEVLSRSFSY